MKTYNESLINSLIKFIFENKGINKDNLAQLVQKQFSLIKGKSVYYCDDFAIRFCYAKKKNLDNVILGLSKLRKYDDRPFFISISLPKENDVLLANTSLLRKISHSSKKLSETKIRGSFTGSDIMRTCREYKNEPKDFLELYNIHVESSWEDNLRRLVKATRNIVPTGKKIQLNDVQKEIFMQAPERAEKFCSSQEFKSLKEDLDARVKAVEKEILIAACIENVKIRGNLIEYLISHDKSETAMIINALHNQTNIPDFQLSNDLGDFNKLYTSFDTKTDIKTHILSLNSTPKAYNLDKLIKFLSQEKSVYMLYFVGITKENKMKTALVSMYQKQLLESPIITHHLSGRNSRGTAQFTGTAIQQLLDDFCNDINIQESKAFNEKILGM